MGVNQVYSTTTYVPNASPWAIEHSQKFDNLLCVQAWILLLIIKFCPMPLTVRMSVPDRLLGTRTWMLIARAEDKMCMWQKMRYVSRTRERPRHPSRFVRPRLPANSTSDTTTTTIAEELSVSLKRHPRLPKSHPTPSHPAPTHTNEYTPPPIGCDSVSKSEKGEGDKRGGRGSKGGNFGKEGGRNHRRNHCGGRGGRI